MNTLRPVPVLAELSTRESTRKPQIEAHPSVAASDSEARESTQRETIVTDGTESQSLTLAAGRFNLASGKTDCAGDHNTLVKLVPFLVSASKAGTARHQFQSWCPCQGNDNQVQPSVGETAGKQKAETAGRDRHLNTCRQRGRNSLASNTSWIIPQGTAQSRANFTQPTMTRITTLEELAAAVEQKRSVVDHGGRRMPAAFVMSMQARIVYNLLRFGLWLYPLKARQPKALLAEGIPSFAKVGWGDNRTGRYICTVLDAAYVWRDFGGSCFVPKHLLRVIHES